MNKQQMPISIPSAGTDAGICTKADDTSVSQTCIKPNVVGSTGEFRIHGRARKELKKKVGFLKGYVRHFWHFEDCNRVNGSWMDDAECQRQIDNANEEIKYLENQLNEKL